MCYAFQVISDIVAIMEEPVLTIGTRESVKFHLYEFFIFPALDLPHSVFAAESIYFKIPFFVYVSISLYAV